ncbi:MAG: hypothetical protein OEU95_09970, partial [Nitrospirota bacterium]|nr:hypothetical protein [Nitrospirota bacterium]
EQYKGLNNSRVKIRIVNSGYLTADHSELETDIEVLSSTSDELWVTFQLGGPNFMNRRFPPYVYVADHCIWVRHFKGPECGYTGPDGTCKGTLEDCQMKGQNRRYSGKPGLSVRGVRLV